MGVSFLYTLGLGDIVVLPQFIFMWNTLYALFEDLVDVIYPRCCGACDENAPMRKSPFCIQCLSELPYTGYHMIPDNPFEQQFWGRVNITAGAAMLYFVPGGTTQHLLHEIKYRGKRELAIRMGELYAHELKTAPRFSEIELVVPVPLHWKKKRRRGYNQSEALAKGIANTLGVPMSSQILKRTRAGTSLTSLSRIERLQAVHDVFKVTDSADLADQRVLLVDDVLTTGATLETCAKQLQNAGARVSLCTLACGRI